MFQWDDGIAADQYRLYQARNIIRRVIEIQPETRGVVKADVRVENLAEESEKPKMMRTYISLHQDRGKDSYRKIEDVVSDTKLRQQMLIEAQREMTLFCQKYNRLAELADVFAAMQQLLVS